MNDIYEDIDTLKDHINVLILERNRLEIQVKKQKEMIDKAIKYINSSDISIDIRKTDESLDYVSTDELLQILENKEVAE